MEEEDNIIVKWAQEDVETSYSLLNKINKFNKSHCLKLLYRVIHKSLRDIRPLRYSSRDGHAEGEHVNRGTDTPSFCPTLQVLDMSTLGDAADVNPAKFQDTERFLFPVHAMFRHDCPLAVKPASMLRRLVHKKNLERFSACRYAAFCCVCLGCCAAEFGNSGGTYELPCTLRKGNQNTFCCVT